MLKINAVHYMPFEAFRFCSRFSLCRPYYDVVYFGYSTKLLEKCSLAAKNTHSRYVR